MAEGVDYAWARPSPAMLAGLGKVFAVRYGGPGSSGKHLSPSEAVALNAAGLTVVANAEGAADGMLRGWNEGVTWARQAEAHFKACGMPAGKPIYFSADFDVQAGSQWTAVAQALRGAASVIGLARVGVYGGVNVMRWARASGVATWFWQTYAWSDGQWAAGNHLEQYRNGVTLGGVAQIDLNRSKAADFGQWVVGGMEMLNERELRIISNSYQMLYEQAHEHNPIKWISNVDTGAWMELPNLPLERAVRTEQKVDALTAKVDAIAAAISAAGGSADGAAILAALTALRHNVGDDTRDALIDMSKGGAQGVEDGRNT